MDTNSRSHDAAVALFLVKVEQALVELRNAMQPVERPFLSVSEFSVLVAKTQRTVRGWIKLGKLRAHRADGSGRRGKFLIPREELRPALKKARVSFDSTASVAQQRLRMNQ